VNRPFSQYCSNSFLQKTICRLVLLMYFRLCVNKDESYQRRKSPTEPHRLFRSRTPLKRFKRTSFERKSFFLRSAARLHFAASLRSEKTQYLQVRVLDCFFYLFISTMPFICLWVSCFSTPLFILVSGCKADT